MSNLIPNIVLELLDLPSIPRDFHIQLDIFHNSSRFASADLPVFQHLCAEHTHVQEAEKDFASQKSITRKAARQTVANGASQLNLRKFGENDFESNFVFLDISVTLVLNNTERGLLETSEDLDLEMSSSNSFIVFGIDKPEDETSQPTLTTNDWMEINSPKKNVSKN